MNEQHIPLNRNLDEIDSEKLRQGKDQTECIKCGGLSYEHDHYNNEYTCIKCGWIVKKQPETDRLSKTIDKSEKVSFFDKLTNPTSKERERFNTSLNRIWQHTIILTGICWIIQQLFPSFLPYRIANFKFIELTASCLISVLIIKGIFFLFKGIMYLLRLGADKDSSIVAPNQRGRILLLGIASFLFGIFGLIAVSKAIRSLILIRNGAMDYTGKNIIYAGIVLGVVGFGVNITIIIYNYIN